MKEESIKLCINCKHYHIDTDTDPCRSCWKDRLTRDEWRPKDDPVKKEPNKKRSCETCKQLSGDGISCKHHGLWGCDKIPFDGVKLPEWEPKPVTCPKCGRTGEYISESSIDGMSKYFCLICDKWFGGDMNNCGNCKHLKVDDFKGACVGCTTYPKDTPFKHWEAAKSCQSCKYKGNGWIHPCDSCCPTTYSNWESNESPDKCKTCKHRKPPHRGCVTCREADDGVYPSWEPKDPPTRKFNIGDRVKINLKGAIGIGDKKGYDGRITKVTRFYSSNGHYLYRLETDAGFLAWDEKYLEAEPFLGWDEKKKDDDVERIGVLVEIPYVINGQAPDYGVGVMVKDYKKAAIKVNGKIELDDVAIKSLREQLIPPFVTDSNTKITVIEPLNDMERTIMRTDVENEFSSQVKEIKQEFDDRLKDLVDDITDFKREWINREMGRRKEVIE